MRCLGEPTVDASHPEPATAGDAATKMLEIYETERGPLPAAGTFDAQRDNAAAHSGLPPELTLDAFQRRGAPRGGDAVSRGSRGTRLAREL